VTAKVQGVAGMGLSLATGSDTFTGKISGNSLDLSIIEPWAGPAAPVPSHATPTWSARLPEILLTGSVTYTYATNKNADCGTRDTCQDIQRFTAPAPPEL